MHNAIAPTPPTPEQRDQLEKEYRELYWVHNEHQLACPDNLDEIEEIACQMEDITDELGYVPAA